MATTRDEDLFAGSSMSFGDHLEELRTCLWKAVLGLAIGTTVGLLVGTHVVNFIKYPLQRSLEEYYREGAKADYNTYADERLAAHLPLPYSKQEVADLVDNKKMICTIYRIHRSALRTSLGMEPAPSSQSKSGIKNNDAGQGAVQTNTESGHTPVPAKSDDASVKTEIQEPLEALIVWRPISEDDRAMVKSMSAQEPFMIWLKASLLAGVILSSPWVFYQLWNFVAAGLYPHEKRYVHLYLPFSIGLFLAGAALCFFGVFKVVLAFFLTYNRSLGIGPEQRINEWLGFALFLPIGFGLSFQLPLIMLFLYRVGIFTIEAYLAKWRIAVLVIFIVAMILTPSDPYSMLMMAIPLSLLYFLGIALCKYMPRPKNLLET